MSSDPNADTPLSREAADALRALRKPVAPPAELYTAVASRLRSDGAFTSRTRRTPYALGIAAAIALAFLGGVLVGRSPQSTAAVNTDPQFVIVLLKTRTPSPPLGMTNAEIVEEYRNWVAPLAREGRVALAEELAPERYLVDRVGAQPGAVADGVDGLFVVRAPDVAGALALAGTLPHVRDGGVVAVQRVMTR